MLAGGSCQPGVAEGLGSGGRAASRATGGGQRGCSLEADRGLVFPLIIRDPQFGVDRFDALADDLGISRNLLTPGSPAHIPAQLEGGYGRLKRSGCCD